jgi:hypothetical protein
MLKRKSMNDVPGQLLGVDGTRFERDQTADAPA